MFDSYAYDLIKVISNDVFEGMVCLFLYARGTGQWHQLKLRV